MSYYNPYNNERYYDPSSYANKGQRPTEQMGSAIGSFAKNMAAYMVVSTIGNAALSAASKGIGKAFKAKATAAVKAGTAGHFSKTMSQVNTPTLSSVIKSTQLGGQIYSDINKVTGKYTAAYAARKQNLSALKARDPLAANKARLTSIFQDKETFVGTAGSLIRKHAIRGSTMSFIYDTAVGNIEHQGIQARPIFDIPGQVMNYANYMRKNTLSFTVMGSLGGMAEAGKGLAGVGLRNFFSQNKGLRDSAVDFLSTISRPNFGAGSKTDFFRSQVTKFQSRHEEKFFRRTVNDLKAGAGTSVDFARNALTNAINKTYDHVKHNVKHNYASSGAGGSFQESVQQVSQEIKDIWIAKREQATTGIILGTADLPGLGLLETLSDVKGSVTKTGVTSSRDTSAHQTFLNAITEFNDQIKSKSFIGNVLGLKQSTVGDVVNTKYVGSISKNMASYFPNGDVSQLQSAVSNTFIGKNIFKHGDKHIDVSVLDPLSQVKRLGQKIGGINISIPGLGTTFNLGNFSFLNNLTSERVYAAPFRKSTTGLGHIVDSQNIVDSKFKLNSRRPKTLQDLVSEASQTTGFGVGGDVGVSYIAGKFYATDGTNVTQLAAAPTVLRTMSGYTNEFKSVALDKLIYYNHREDKGLQDLVKANNKNKSIMRGNPVSDYLQKVDWEVPPALKYACRRVTKALLPGKLRGSGGKQLNYTEDLYATALDGLFGQDVRVDKLHDHVPVLRQLMQNVDQDVGVMLRSKTIFEELAMRSSSKLSKFDSTIMHNNAKFVDRLRELKLNNDELFYTLSRDPHIRKLYNSAIHDPKKTANHTLFARNGNLNSLTSMDSLKVHYVSEAVSSSWDGVDKHPFIEAADFLLDTGKITKRQASALKLKGTLETVFKDGRLSQFPSTPTPESQNLFKQTLDSIKHRNNVELQDFIDYIGDTDLRAPIDKSFIGGITEGFGQDLFRDALRTSPHLTDHSPYFSYGVTDINSNNFGAFAGSILDVAGQRLSNLIHGTTGLKRDPLKYGDGFKGAMKFMTTRTAQVAAAGLVYNMADSFVAANPVFDNTSLNAGITGLLADNAAKLHLFSNRAVNAVGLGGVGRYLEGAMPGFTSSAPGAIIGGALNYSSGPIGVVKGAFQGAIANRILSPLMPDYTKTYEQLREEYSGERDVPIIDGKMWFLGSTPWQGGKVVGWQPNWYVRAKSRWRSSDTLYGSEFRKVLHEPIFPLGISIGDVVDPYYVERKNYYSRPYPVTAPLGDEIPLGLGPIIGGTIGRLIKPQKLMHRDHLYGDLDDAESPVSAIAPPNLSESLGMMHTRTWDPNKSSARTGFMGSYSYPGTKFYGHEIGERSLRKFEHTMGFLGFQAGILRRGLTTNENITMPTLETAGRISSMTRSYNDMNLGGLGMYCLPEYEKVLTVNGLRKIVDVKIGDFVYDNSYKLQRVTNVFSRVCGINEKLYTLTISAGKTNISITWNHPVAIYRRGKCNDNKMRPCIPNRSKKCISCSKRNNCIKWEWVNAEDINVGDFAVMPLPKVNTKNIIDLSEFHSGGITNNHIYSSTREFSNVIQLLEQSPHLSRNELINHDIPDTYCKQALSSIKNSRNIRRNTRHILINNNVAYFLGWWLAEGSVNIKTGTISLSMNINEINYANKLKDIILTEFNKSANITLKPDVNTLILSFKYLTLSKYLKSYGDVYSKQLKTLINLPDEQATYLLEGLFLGDGWLNSKLQKGRYTSISSRLVRDIWLLLYRLGVQSGINIDYLEIPKTSYLLNGTKHKPSIRSYLNFSKNGYVNFNNIISNRKSNGCISNGIVFTDDNYLYIKISNISSIDYSNNIVYDIEVENSHNFISNYILVHNSELVRRFVEKPDHRKYGVNPIPNLMPNWLPDRFRKGDPFASIIRGELRLPGKAYEITSPTLQHDMPGLAQMLGASLRQNVRYFTGDLSPELKDEYDLNQPDEQMKHIVRDYLQAEGLLIQGRSLVYDVENDIKGKVDGIISDGYGGMGRRALTIKALKDSSFAEISGPKSHHASEINFYMRELGLQEGRILYVNSDNPSEFQMYDIAYDGAKLQQDIDKLHKSRSTTSQMMAKGKTGEGFGETYSWLDRLDILADVAPHDEKFRVAKQIVEEQIKSGMLSQKDIQRYRRIGKKRDAVIRKYELYPLRFKGKVMSPDTETNIMSLNENIKAAADYSLPERCFYKKTIIETKIGFKYIKDIVVGDFVRTHDNSWKRVNRVMCRPVEQQESVYELCIQSREKTIVTEEHPYYAVRSIPCKNWSSKNSVCIIKQNNKCNNCKHHYYKNYKPEWVTVKDLTSDHFIATPIININTILNDIDLYELLKCEKNIECVNNMIRFNHYNVKNENQGVQVPRYIKRTPELYELFGWYIVEGSRNSSGYPYNGLNFSLHKSEENVAIRLAYLFNQIFNVRSFSIKSKSENGIELRLYSSLVSIIFQKLFGHSCKNKVIPEFIYGTTNENIKSLIHSILLGDGCSKGKINTITLTSKSVIYCINNLLLHLGYLPNINIKHGGNIVKIHKNKNTSITSDCWIVSWSDELIQHNNRYIYDGYYYTRVISKKMVNLDEVYNIEVEESHTYIANGLAVHNCIYAQWEKLINNNLPVFNKFFQYKDPLEHYRRFQVYGQEYTPWTDPYGSFIEPRLNLMRAAENPAQGAISWGFNSSVALGPGGGLLGAAFGGIYGAAHGAFKRYSSGPAYIPEQRQEERQINQYFDELKYHRYHRMSYLTHGHMQEEYAQKSKSTLYNLSRGDGDIGDLYSAVDYREKPYIHGFVNETDPRRREEILRHLPDDLSISLHNMWKNQDKKEMTNDYIEGVSANMDRNLGKPNYTTQELDPSLFLDDIKLKTINRHGHNAHNYGLGWQEQMLRVQHGLDDIHVPNIYDRTYSSHYHVDVGSVKSSLLTLFNRLNIRNNVQVFGNTHTDGDNVVFLTVMRSKGHSLSHSINNREAAL